MIKSLYIIGSLRNPVVPDIANAFQALGIDTFSDWFGAGERADDAWREHEQKRGRNYLQALKGYGARHVFEFDKYHLERCDAAVLVLPAGKSGHLELGYAAGRGKPTYILLPEEPERWDVMYQFATGVYDKMEPLLQALKGLNENN